MTDLEFKGKYKPIIDGFNARIKERYSDSGKIACGSPYYDFRGITLELTNKNHLVEDYEEEYDRLKMCGKAKIMYVTWKMHAPSKTRYYGTDVYSDFLELVNIVKDIIRDGEGD